MSGDVEEADAAFLLANTSPFCRLRLITSDVRNDDDGGDDKHQLAAVLTANKIQPIKQEDLLLINGSLKYPFIQLICEGNDR